MNTIYEAVLGEASALKLRAVTARVQGEDGPFRAAVLLHEASRAERRALKALDAPDAMTRLRVAVERCGCLVEGRDPTAVLESAWGEVLDASAFVEEATARALRGRLDPAVSALLDEYRASVAQMGDTFAWVQAGGHSTPSKEVVRQVSEFVRRFPGDVRGWQVVAQATHRIGALADAWRAVQRARELDPDDALGQGIELLLASDVLDGARLRRLVDAVFVRVAREPATVEVCLDLCVAMIALARREPGDAPTLWARVAEVASLGMGLPLQDTRDRPMLRAVRMVAQATLAGQPVTRDLLYRAGLGPWIEGLQREGMSSPVDMLLRCVPATTYGPRLP